LRKTLAAALLVAAVAVGISGHEAPHPDAGLAPARNRPDSGPVLVIGGNRDTGLEVVRLLRARGTAVTVFVRPASDASAAAALGAQIVRGDALSRADLDAAVRAVPYAAIVSTLGRSLAPGTRADDVGNRNAIDAARSAGVRRFVLVTVIGAGDSRDTAYFLARRALRQVMADKTVAEDYLRASGLDYTILRPGGLLNGPDSGRAYLTPDVGAFSWIRRADLARLVVQALDDPRAVGRVYHAFDPGITRFWEVPVG
jgi:uncharacterized protein YbjT (DUF2867 family)